MTSVSPSNGAQNVCRCFFTCSAYEDVLSCCVVEEDVCPYNDPTSRRLFARLRILARKVRQTLTRGSPHRAGACRRSRRHIPH